MVSVSADESCSGSDVGSFVVENGDRESGHGVEENGGGKRHGGDCSECSPGPAICAATVSARHVRARRLFALKNVGCEWRTRLPASRAGVLAEVLPCRRSIVS
jgi:hypothetical protein